MKILVVDDEALLVKGIRFNLQNEGYDVITGSDGLDAVRLVQEQNPDLLVLDVMMPNMDGLTACSKIREFSDIPIIQVFKTLVTKAASGAYYVFDIPVAESLDLKKAAKAVGEKSIAMIPQKDLLPLTGYIHGGCSPIGMKKQFPTVIHETAQLFDTVCISAGKIGAQAELSPFDLQTLLGASFADVTADA